MSIQDIVASINSIGNQFNALAAQIQADLDAAEPDNQKLKLQQRRDELTRQRYACRDSELRAAIDNDLGKIQEELLKYEE